MIKKKKKKKNKKYPISILLLRIKDEFFKLSKYIKYIYFGFK